MARESLAARQEESRLSKELAALQARTSADMERMRTETAGGQWCVRVGAWVRLLLAYVHGIGVR